MKKDMCFSAIFTIIEVVIILAIKGFSYPLLPLFLLLSIFNYISIEDWRTGFITLKLNIFILLLSVIYSIISSISIKIIAINLACFVLPFIIVEFLFQRFCNKEKDEERFLVGGGDIILFGAACFILNMPQMMIMLFIAAFISIIISKIIKKSRVHFAPLILIGFFISYLWGEVLVTGINSAIEGIIYSLL